MVPSAAVVENIKANLLAWFLKCSPSKRNSSNNAVTPLSEVSGSNATSCGNRSDSGNGSGNGMYNQLTWYIEIATKLRITQERYKEIKAIEDAKRARQERLFIRQLDREIMGEPVLPTFPEAGGESDSDLDNDLKNIC